MLVYAENNPLGEEVKTLLGYGGEVISDVDEWPTSSSSSLVVISSLSSPILIHLLRLHIAHVEKEGTLVIVKKDYKGDEEDRIDKWLRSEYARLHNENELRIGRVSKLAECKWRNERLHTLRSWKTVPMLQYSVVALGSQLRHEVDRLFPVATPSFEEPQAEVTKKPPNLHWTPCALEGDMEVTIRFSFSLSVPDRSFLSLIASSASSFFSSVYEWIDGVLISNDSARVHVQRTSHSVIDVSGRVCYEELEDPSTASSLLWPLLSFPLRHLLSSLSSSPFLQYQSELILIGGPLFSPPTKSRAFDLTTFMSTAAKYQKVAFMLNEQVHEVKLPTLFPKGVPDSLSSLFLEGDSLPTRRPPSPSLAPSPTSSLSLPQSHNRGRRVSFGAIRTVGGVDDYVDNMLQQSIVHT